MRVIVAGSRWFEDYATAEKNITACLCTLSPVDPVVILSGGCRGVDALGERYAAQHGMAVERFLPQWSRYGKRAGPLRNRTMADSCDAVICFWDGVSRGTKSLLDYAKRQQKLVYIIPIERQ